MKGNTRKTLDGRVSNNFDNNGNYRPGSVSKVIKSKSIVPEISKNLKTIICKCIDSEIGKGRTIEEAISVIANNERIQIRLADYYFFKQKVGEGIEFSEIVKRIYRDKKIEEKLLEDTER